jgi:hypothetical protein
MNTNRLAKMYHLLTPQERLPLVLAAQKRGDEIEQQRLTISAPLGRFDPDYVQRELMLQPLALAYIKEQLQHLTDHTLAGVFARRKDESQDWLCVEPLSAYLFCCNVQAWRRFCQEQNVDPEQLIAANYPGGMLPSATEQMPRIAPSRDELAATLKARGWADPVPVTVDDLVERWRRALEQRKNEEAAANAG